MAFLHADNNHYLIFNLSFFYDRPILLRKQRMLKLIQKNIIALLIALSLPISEAAVKISKISAKNITGFYVDVTTNYPSHMRVQYGRSPGSLKESVHDFVYKTSHTVAIEGLNFGTKYYYQIFVSGRGGKTNKTKILYYITEKK